MFRNPQYPEDLEQIKGWREKVSNLLLADSIKDHEGIKMIREYFVDLIRSLDARLLSERSDVLPNEKRDAIFEVRDIVYWFLSLFGNIDEQISEIEKSVKEEEDNLHSVYK